MSCKARGTPTTLSTPGCLVVALKTTIGIIFFPGEHSKSSNVIVLAVRKCITASPEPPLQITYCSTNFNVCSVLRFSNCCTIQVFLCNNATCGHFYHPKCVAKRLHPNNRNEATELEKKISEGFSFTCPIHWCFRCKGLEDRTQEPLQFAVCRRCPKSYHRKCLPRWYYRICSLSCFNFIT